MSLYRQAFRYSTGRKNPDLGNGNFFGELKTAWEQPLKLRACSGTFCIQVQGIGLKPVMRAGKGTGQWLYILRETSLCYLGTETLSFFFPGVFSVLGQVLT